MSVEIIFGLLCLFLICASVAALATVIWDILSMRNGFGVSWKDSIKLGWLYFIERFKK